MAKENLRALSLDVVMEVLEKQGFSNQVLNAVLSKYQYLEKQERSFISRLSLGTIENAFLLDEIINS
jgi:16S rRNA (cytosine967-C5)-methyltransferase